MKTIEKGRNVILIEVPSVKKMGVGVGVLLIMPLLLKVGLYLWPSVVIYLFMSAMVDYLPSKGDEVDYGGLFVMISFILSCINSYHLGCQKTLEEGRLYEAYMFIDQIASVYPY